MPEYKVETLHSARALFLNSGVGPWKNGVFTLVPSDKGAQCSGTQCEHGLSLTSHGNQAGRAVELYKRCNLKSTFLPHNTFDYQCVVDFATAIPRLLFKFTPHRVACRHISEQCTEFPVAILNWGTEKAWVMSTPEWPRVLDYKMAAETIGWVYPLPSKNTCSGGNSQRMLQDSLTVTRSYFFTVHFNS